MAAQEDQILLLRKLPGNVLVKHTPLGRHVENPGTLPQAGGQGLIGVKHRPRLHHHPGSPSVRGVVHMMMLIFRIIPDIDRIHPDQPLLHRAARNACI